MWQQLYEVRPGVTSQTTNRIEELIRPDDLILSFFDINSPIIETSKQNVWDKTARQILQEHTELWERLADL